MLPCLRFAGKSGTGRRMANETPPTIFSTARRSARFGRAVALQDRSNPARYLGDTMADDVLDRLSFIRHNPGTALVIGDLSGRLTEALARTEAQVSSLGPDNIDESLPYPAGNFDFIASLGTLDTVNDLPGALVHLRHALAPGGIAMASFLAAGSLPNLRRALLAADGERPAARMHPMVDAGAGAALMQRAGFARQVVDSHSLKVSFRSLDRLIADLREQGQTNVLLHSPPPLTRDACARARAAFLESADSEGRVVETFEILTLTGWR
jgi:SAM-dependent methyltransferase